MLFNNVQKIKSYDLIVVGNCLAAVVSAGMAAKNGKAVALVTESELLFGEYSEGALGFVRNTSPLFTLLSDMGAEPFLCGEEYHIPRGMASKIALKYLRDNNVNVFLKAAPIGLLTRDAEVLGIAVATKFGAYAVKGGFVADFSDRRFYKSSEKQKGEYLYAFQMGGVDCIGKPCHLEVDINGVEEVTVHGDCRSEDTCVVTFKTNSGRIENCISKATELTQFLIKNNPAFEKGGMINFALRPVGVEPYYNTSFKNLLTFGAGSILNSDDYYNAITFVTDLINTFLNKSLIKEAVTLKMEYGEFDLEALYTGDELDEFLSAEIKRIKIPTENIPTVSTDLFIAGLGAGGTSAMNAATQNGCRVVGAEALAVPCGTRGQGRVSAFWHGYQGGYAVKNLKDVKDFKKANLGQDVPHNIAEMIYNIKVGEGAKVFYSTIVFDAVKQGTDTVGALLATPEGVTLVKANKLIDATGDADLAALSGVEYMPNGDPRDKVTQGYSIWGDEKVGTVFQDSLYKSDEDSISTEKYSEFLRGIFTSHSVQSDLGFSALLTVRESRRIKGKYILNMKDILKEKTFDDTVTVSLCKYDAHGMGTSPAYYTTIFNALRDKTIPDVCTRIPLRALLPENDNGIMVISKAISATRDAGCLIRMNPDIQNTGYAAGLIAANAAKNNLDFEKAYTDQIKARLIEAEILPDYYNKSPELKADELIKSIKEVDVWARAVATVCPDMLADFEAAYDGNENLAMVLATLGSHLPFADMLSKLKKLVEVHKNEESAEAFSSTDNATLVESGKAEKASPDKIKNLSVLLSRLAADNEAEKAELLPILAEAIETIEAGGGYGNPAKGIYQNSKVSSRVVPNYKAILGLVIAAETVADKSLAEPLIKLSQKQYIRLSDGDEIHSVQLYLRIMAAAARCHSEFAVSELEKYKNSERLFFRLFAESELNSIALNGPAPVPADEFWI